MVTESTLCGVWGRERGGKKKNILFGFISLKPYNKLPSPFLNRDLTSLIISPKVMTEQMAAHEFELWCF